MQGETLEGLLRQYTSNSINNMFTSIPGRIIKVVNAGEQRVDVRPIVSKISTDDQTRDHPVILSVPLVYPGSKDAQFSFPVKEGDIVLLVFSQRSIQRFKQGAETPHRPIDLGKYSRNDAVAIPGLFSFPNAVNQNSKRTLSHSTEDTVVTGNIGTGQEAEVRIKSNGDVVVSTAGDANIQFNINGSTVLNLSSSEANFNIPITAPNLTTDIGVSVNDHTHSQGSDSDGNSEVETNPPTT